MIEREKIEDLVNFERDKRSRAVVNTDSNALKAYKIQRQNMMKFNKITDLETEMLGLKNDINDIKNLLVQLINNK